MKGDLQWYKDMWSTRQNHQCEECGVRLLHFHPMFVSHIITKGSYPSLRKHPENWMLYCMSCHQQWEFGKRKEMKTYPRAMEITEKLKREYHEAKNR
jgi:5-methylcytosine-specific restriction endonuclease McrA